MGRNIILASADGSAASSSSGGLTTAQVNTLIEAKTGWEPVKEITLSGTVTSIDFSGSEYDTDTYQGFKAFFPGFYVGSGMNAYVQWKNPASNNGSFWVRSPDGYGTYNGSNTNTMYLTSQQHYGGSWFSGELTWFLGDRPHGFFNSWGDMYGYWGSHSECGFNYASSGGTINGLVLNGLYWNISSSNTDKVFVYGLRKRT